MRHCNDCNQDKEDTCDNFYTTANAPLDCKECLRSRDKLKYANRTPEQIEAEKKYRAERHQRRKGERR